MTDMTPWGGGEDNGHDMVTTAEQLHRKPQTCSTCGKDLYCGECLADVRSETFPPLEPHHERRLARLLWQSYLDAPEGHFEGQCQLVAEVLGYGTDGAAVQRVVVDVYQNTPTTTPIDELDEALAAALRQQ